MTQTGRYTILGEIAAGGTATVFLAEDCVLRRKVALKKLHPHLLNHPEMVRRFKQEAVAVASLSHENVIKIFDYGYEGKSMFLAMEYVDGASLETVLRDAGDLLPNLAALSLFHQLLEGLAAAHARGVYHRDIKPSNVLVDRKGRVRIADFGIAFLAEETSITKTGAYLGTPGYSAPEQAEGKAVTDKTDIFATGILLYRCLAGKLPFEAETPHAVLVSIMERTPVKADMVNRRILPGLASLAQEMLAKAPADRPDAATCARRLASLAEDLGVSAGADRLRGLLQEPVAYATREIGELAERIASQARTAEKTGKRRDAMKLYATAELIAGADSEIGREAARFLARMRRQARRTRAAACALAAMLVLAGLAWLRVAHPFAVPRDPGAGALSAPARATGGADAPRLASPVTAVPAPASAAQPVAGSRPMPSARLSRSRIPLKPLAKRRSAPPPPAGAQGGAPVPAPGAAPQPPAEGFVSVRTNPPFARVKVDGEASGATPMRAPVRLAAGDHLLELERDGCKPTRLPFRIAARETTLVRVSLERSESP